MQDSQVGLQMYFVVISSHNMYSRESSLSRYTLMPMSQGPVYVSSSDEEDKMFPAVQVSTEDIMMIACYRKRNYIDNVSKIHFVYSLRLIILLVR